MKIIFFLMLSVSLIILALTIILNILSKKTFSDREKNSPFECGFDPKNLSRLPFSSQFFLIAVIFVIFDVELSLLLPVILIIKTSNLMFMSITLYTFLMILLFGLYHEQSQGSLNWVK